MSQFLPSFEATEHLYSQRFDDSATPSKMEYYASLIGRILKIWKSPNLDGVRSREMRRALLSFIPRTPKLTSISKSEF